MKERIIKDYDNMGMRCNYTVQMYLEGKKEWVYKKTYNAKGFNPHMPKWFNTRKEAEALFGKDSKKMPDVTLGIDDKTEPVENPKDAPKDAPIKYKKEKEVLRNIKRIMKSIDLHRNPLWNDAGGSTFFNDIYNDLECIKVKVEKEIQIREGKG